MAPPRQTRFLSPEKPAGTGDPPQPSPVEINIDDGNVGKARRDGRGQFRGHFRGQFRGHFRGRGRGTQSPKSFNNHLGVPLTLLAAKESDDFVVVEVGTNHPGEIAFLGAIVEPDVAVITNVGLAHLQGLGDLQAVAIEKASLLRFVRRGGLAVVNGDQSEMTRHTGELPQGVDLAYFGQASTHHARLICCEEGGSQGTRFQADFSELTPGQTDPTLVIRTKPQRFNLPLLGEHNAFNALAALLVARWFGVDERAMAASLATVTPVEMRLQTHRVGDPDQPITVINDAYNANPQSMAAALETLARFPLPSPDSRRVIILGDMLELGDVGIEEHRRLGDHIAQIDRLTRITAASGSGESNACSGGSARETPQSSNESTDLDSPKSLAAQHGGIDIAVLIGNHAAYTACRLGELWANRGSKCVYGFPNCGDRLADKVVSMIMPGDLVLIKGSRGLGLERLIPVMERHQATTASRAI